MRNDYIMDMIEDFGELLQNLKNKTSHREEISTVNHDASLGEAGLVGIMLKRMCIAGNVNEAENLLFENVEQNPTPDYFYVALDFYRELAKQSDEWLLECDFSRQEIKDGMNEIIKIAAENGIAAEKL